MSDFWDAIKPWLISRGVLLYDRRLPECAKPWDGLLKTWYSPLASTAAPLPFARCVGDILTASNSFRAGVSDPYA